MTRYCSDLVLLTIVTTFVSQNFVDTNAALTSSEIERCTAAHNKLRVLHINTQPLEWDESLATKAQQYAEELVRINQKTDMIRLVHEQGTNLGENLYWRDNQQKGTCSQASLAWYIEIDDYDYNTARSKNGKAVGHFTQMVWRETTKFGVGIATMRSRAYSSYGNIETFIVAKYSPRGNFHYIGHRFEDYSRNVQPRIPGSITPTLQQLGEQSTTTKQVHANRRVCKNKAGDNRCHMFINVWGYNCHGNDQSKAFFQEQCSKKCGHC